MSKAKTVLTNEYGNMLVLTLTIDDVSSPIAIISNLDDADDFIKAMELPNNYTVHVTGVAVNPNLDYAKGWVKAVTNRKEAQR